MSDEGIGGSITGDATQFRFRDVIVPYYAFDYDLAEAAPNTRQSLHAGTPDILEAGDGTLQLFGWAMDTGDIVGAQVFRPDDIDLNTGLDIRCALGFQVQAASRTGIDWKATIKGVAHGAARSVMTTSPDGSIVFAAEANTSAMEVRETPFMPFALLDGSGVNALLNDLIFDLSVELDDRGDATANQVALLYAKLRFTRKLAADGSVRETT